MANVLINYNVKYQLKKSNAQLKFNRPRVQVHSRLINLNIFCYCTLTLLCIA